MNCDQAFECITDPTVVGDDALEAHLQHCPRCRDMAEILEPALRFVNGQSEQSWPEAGWDFPQATEGQATKPFLSQQAVWAAEEAAAVLTARKTRREKTTRSRWLVLAVMTPMVALALFVANRIETKKEMRPSNSVVYPELGLCSRAMAAQISTSAESGEKFKAREIVLSCNTCHLLDPSPRFHHEKHLKLRPVELDENAEAFRGDIPAPDVGLRSLLQRNMAAVPSHNHAC